MSHGVSCMFTIAGTLVRQLFIKNLKICKIALLMHEYQTKCNVMSYLNVQETNACFQFTFELLMKFLDFTYEPYENLPFK
jgi:hypothetical protein